MEQKNKKLSREEIEMRASVEYHKYKLLLKLAELHALEPDFVAQCVENWLEREGEVV